MTAIPQPSHGTAQLVHELHARRAASKPARDYLGWSQIGEPCDRALWYSFRWAEREQIEGRIARLFDSGHREEARLLQDLKDAGVQVWDRDPETGEQFAVSSVGGHLRGHLDAVALGLPEAPKTAHLVDVKTASTKKFDELLKKGMRALYPKYWAQAHGYCGHMKLTRAAFIFVCKDDDRIHIERFEFDRAEFERYEARAEKIVRASEPPLRIHDDPAWHECRFCAYREVCKGDTAPQVSCRTCTHSTPVLDGEDGAWRCEHHDCEVPTGWQRTGCDAHRYIPILLERIGRPVDVVNATDVVYETAEGGRFVNGEPPEGFSSAEIRACADKRALTSIPELHQWRRELGARVVA
jgi:CRISPR/Cas system-associated exonuclease Cas4 (RecB family)